MISNRLAGALTALAALALGSCTPDFSVPSSAMIDCQSDGDCPAGMRCSASQGRCIGVYNELPSVELAPVARSTGIVSLELLVIDAESAAVTLLAEIDTGEGFVPVSLSPSTVPSSPEGLPALVLWDAAATFGSTAYRPQVTLRLTAAEAGGSGNSVTRAFAFGNDAPVVDELGVDDATVSGMTVVRFRAHDSASDRLTVDKLELAFSSDFSDAVAIPLETGVGAHFPSGALSDLTCPASGELGGAIWHSFAWSSALVAPRESDAARLRLTVRDALGASSVAVASPAFAIDNANTLPVVTLASSPTGTVTSAASLTYLIEDGDLDLCSVRAEYSTDGATWSIAASASPTTGIASGPPASRFDWEASSLPPGLYPNVVLRLQANDGRGWSEPVTTPPFTVDTRLKTPPVVEMLSIGTDVANRPLTSVQLELALSDAESDPVSLAVEYQVGAGAWRPATLRDPQSSYPAPPAGAPVTVVWDLFADAGGGGIELTTLQTSEHGTTQLTVASGLWDVRVRVTPTDAQQVEGGATASLPFLLGNTPPVVQFWPLPAEVSGPVPVQFSLSDYESDLADVVLEFRQHDADPWRRAAIAMGRTIGLQTNASAIGPSTYVLLWNSSAPLDADPSVPQGIGPQLLSTVRLRARAEDSVNGTRFFGPWGTSEADLGVRNQTPPRIADVQAPRSDLSTGHSPVPITFRAIDAESDPVDVQLEYSFDRGNSWVQCREYLVAGSEGTRSLATAPDDGTGAGGIEHRFVWDATGSSLGQVEATWIRVRATDGRTPEPAPVVLRLGKPVAPPLAAPNAIPFDLPVREGPCDYPEEMASADFNEDGAADLAVLCRTPGTVAILLGQKTGTAANGDFAPAWTTPVVASSPLTLTLADFDRDGHVDLALASSGDGKVVVLAGDGLGHLAWVESHTVCSSPTAISHADFDGDGDLDLVASCGGSCSDSLWYLRGTGTRAGGMFMAPETRAPAPCWPRNLRPADLDGDGKMDLATTGQFLKGLGDGTFASGGSLPNEADVDLAIADLNLDGRLDVVVPRRRTNRVAVALGQATSNPFSRVTEYPIDGAPYDAVVADFTGDGTLDIAVTSEAIGPTILVQGQSGGVPSGVFAGATNFSQAGGAKRLLAGDFNSDGYSDLVINGVAQGPYVFLSRPGNGLGTGSFASPVLYSGRFNAVARTADFDADGLLDVLTLGAVALYRGAGTLVPAGTLRPPLPGPIEGAEGGVVADLNRDSNADFAWADWHGDELVVQLSLGREFEGSTVFSSARYGCAPCRMLNQVVAGDFDGDGAPDLAADASGSSHLVVWLGQKNYWGAATGTFGPANVLSASCPATNPPGTSGLAVGDFNGDQRDDLAVTCHGLAAVFVSTGNPAAPFGAPARHPFPSGSSDYTGGVLTTDLDSDGILDLVISNLGAHTLIAMLGNGTAGVGDGTFGSASTGFIAPDDDTEALNMWAADVNRDGVVDLVASGPQETKVFVAKNVGGRGGGYAEEIEYPGDRTQAPGDFNGDAVLDVATGTPGGVTLMPGQHETLLGTWSQPLKTTGTEGFALVGAQACASGTDRFSLPLPPPYVSRHRFQVERGGDLVDFTRGLRRSGLTLPASLVPLTHVWDLGDDRYLRHVVAPDGRLRWQVASRFGRPVGGASSPVRTGLDLTTEGLANQTGIVVDLPIIEAVEDAELDAATGVRVFRRALDWVRGDQLYSDYISSDWLPQVADESAPGGRRDVVRPRPEWHEVARDADGDLSTGTGPRFVVVRAGGQRLVRVLTDRLGIMGAYLQMRP